MVRASKRKRSYERTSRKKMKLAVATNRFFRRADVVMNFAYSMGHITLGPTTPGAAQYWQQHRPTLNDLPINQLTELTSLFDSYRILEFSVTYIPRFNSYDAGNSLSNPVFHAAINDDPLNTLPRTGAYDQATLDIFFERCRSGAKLRDGSRMFTVTQKTPGTSPTTGEQKRFPWVSMGLLTTIAYGIDVFWFAPNFPNGLATTEYEMIMNMKVALRGKR